MKKWYFSKNGSVTGPVNLEEAQAYAQANPDIYGWHPSFKQWKPVSLIMELGNIVATTKPSIHLLTELVEKFKIKKQRLDKKLSVIEQRIEVNENLLSTLHEEITVYKKLTANLSDGVKGAIKGIEQQYLALQEKQSRLHEASSISMMEIDTLVNEFNSRISDKANANNVARKDVANQSNAKVIKANIKKQEQTAEAFLEEQMNEPPALVVNAEPEEIVDIDATPTKQVNQRKVKLVEVNALAQDAAQEVTSVTQPATETVDETNSLPQEQQDKTGFTGMKSLIKSVFKGDEDSSEIQENSLSKLLAMEEAEEEKKAANQPNIAEDEQDKKLKRRTRRRR